MWHEFVNHLLFHKYICIMKTACCILNNFHINLAYLCQSISRVAIVSTTNYKWTSTIYLHTTKSKCLLPSVILTHMNSIQLKTHTEKRWLPIKWHFTILYHILYVYKSNVRNYGCIHLKNIKKSETLGHNFKNL